MRMKNYSSLGVPSKRLLSVLLSLVVTCFANRQHDIWGDPTVACKAKEAGVKFDNGTLTTAVEEWFSDKGPAFAKYGPMENWDTTQVTDMQGLFRDRLNFNENIGCWDTRRVMDMSSMFSGSEHFNANIEMWKVVKVTTMHHMFYQAKSFNQRGISQWYVGKTKDMTETFFDATSFSHNLCWKLEGKITYNMFLGSAGGCLNIGCEDDCKERFANFKHTDDTIYHAVEEWKSNKESAEAKYGRLSYWDVKAVTNMSFLFIGMNTFDEELRCWDTSEVTTMESMFEGAHDFDQDISGWKTSKVVTLKNMFSSSNSFNSNVDRWNVANVVNMGSMFRNAWSFNKDVAPWKVSAVTNFESMFSHAYQFNIDVSPWEVRSATNMNDMFNSATVFNQKLCAWEQLPNFPEKAATNHMFELSSCPIKGVSPFTVCHQCSSFDALNCGKLQARSHAFHDTIKLRRSYRRGGKLIQGLENKSLGEISHPLQTNYQISFTIKPFKTFKGYTSVMRFTADPTSDKAKYGDRAPAIFMYPNSYKLVVSLGSTKRSNIIFNSNVALKQKKENHVELDFDGNEIILHVNGVVAGSKSIPLEERPAITQKLYVSAGDNFHKPAWADVKDINYKQLSFLQTNFPPYTLRQHGVPIGEIIDPARTDFSISFTIKPFSTTKHWNNILRFTADSSSNMKKYGDRAPVFQLVPGTFLLHAGFSSTKSPNHVITSNKALEHNKDNHVKLDFIGNDIMLFINGVMTGSMSVPLSTRPQIEKLHIFGGDMFYATVNAYIKDLTYAHVTQSKQERRTRRWTALNYFRNTNKNGKDCDKSKESSKSSESSSKNSAKETSPIVFPPILLQQNADIIGEIHDPPITNYEISFTIKPLFKKSADYTSILRFTENPSGNLEYYGDRQPLFQFLPNSFTLLIAMSSTLNANNWFNSFVNLENGKYSHIKLECIGDEITLLINGVKTGSMLVPVSTRPKLYQKLLVSAGDKFYAKLNSHISNLSFKRFCNHSPSTPVSYPTRAPVTAQPNCILIKQESTTCCKYGKTFGEIDEGQMWVDNGCRGIFKCFGQQVKCESWHYAYATCPYEASPIHNSIVPPTKAPVSPTKAPVSPTKSPTVSPTKAPTASPTNAPTVSPTKAPVAPTKAPVAPTKPDLPIAFCTKPKSCYGISCVMYCPTGLPAGYYSDLKDKRSYCKCTGTKAPSRYETCQHGLVWDPRGWSAAKKASFEWLQDYGPGKLWASSGGICNWAYNIHDDRPCNK